MSPWIILLIVLIIALVIAYFISAKNNFIVSPPQVTQVARSVQASQPVQGGSSGFYSGVNLAGMEFDSGTFYPTNEEVDYYRKKGMNTFRIPFMGTFAA